MKRAFMLVIIASFLSLANSGRAAVFDVNNEVDLQNALTTASSNGQNDTINIAAGAYDASAGFWYDAAAGEGYSLTIAGDGATPTILDGGNIGQVIYISTLGVANDSTCQITVTGISFQNGRAIGLRGGGLWVRANQANITVENCEFSGNTGNTGGGVCAESSSPASSGDVTFRNNLVRDNTTSQSGGGAYASSPTGSVIFEDNTFQGNTANRGGGATAESSSGSVTYQGNVFDGNTANEGGGAYGSSFSNTVTFVNNTFHGNTAQNEGGGARAHSNSGTITFTNNTAYGNTVNGGNGGGFHVSLALNSATADIYNNIAWNNTSSGNGHDIYVDDDNDGDLTGATVNLYNNDYGSDANDLLVRIGDHLSQGGSMNTDPLLVNPAAGDLHLQTGSPCIDKGTATAPSLPASDCDGEPRTIDSAPDIGADEVSSTPSNPLLYGEIGTDGGFCFIATAAYGSGYSDEVKVFRRFRDDYLLPSELGRTFVAGYYAWSPHLAYCIAKHPMLRGMVRIGLYPMLGLSKWLVEESGPGQAPEKTEHIGSSGGSPENLSYRTSRSVGILDSQGTPVWQSPQP
jgi:hypothetical protein